MLLISQFTVWVWLYNLYGDKTIGKPSMAMVPWKKNITIPLLERNYHSTGLVVFIIKTQVIKVNPKSIFLKRIDGCHKMMKISIFQESRVRVSDAFTKYSNGNREGRLKKILTLSFGNLPPAKFPPAWAEYVYYIKHSPTIAASDNASKSIFYGNCLNICILPFHKDLFFLSKMPITISLFSEQN